MSKAELWVPTKDNDEQKARTFAVQKVSGERGWSNIEFVTSERRIDGVAVLIRGDFDESILPEYGDYRVEDYPLSGRLIDEPQGQGTDAHYEGEGTRPELRDMPSSQGPGSGRPGVGQMPNEQEALSASDLRVDDFRNAASGLAAGGLVRITHIPTGQKAEREWGADTGLGSLLKAKEEALIELTEKVTSDESFRSRST